MLIFTNKSTLLFVRLAGLVTPACAKFERHSECAVAILVLFTLTAICERSPASTIVSDEAYYLALKTSGKLIAPQGLAERIEGDLSLIRETFPIVADIHDSLRWLPGQILVGLSDEAYRDFQAGIYHELDPLLNTFGASVQLPAFNELGLSLVEINFDAKFNPERLGELFSSVSGVKYADPNYLLYFEGPDEVTVTGNRYTFTPGWGHWLSPVCSRPTLRRGPWTFVVEGGKAFEIPEPRSAMLVLLGIPFGGLYLARRRNRGAPGSATIALTTAIGKRP